MKRYFSNFAILIISVFIQVVLMKDVKNFPDIILLTVVFTGIFLDLRSTVIIGFIAGFFRACFSVNPFWLDMFVFLTLGPITFMLSNMLNRYNPVIQMFITAAALLWIFSFQMFFLNVTNNGLSLFSVLFSQWKALAATIFVSPLYFAVSGKILNIDDTYENKNF